MKLSIPQIVIVLASLVFQSTVMVLMIRRRLRSAFPMFFTYMALNNLATVLAIATYLFALPQYFFVYWTLSTLVMTLGFVVLYEVFVDVIKPFSAIIDLGKILFCWAALFLLIAAALTAVVTSGSQANKMVACVELLDRCVHLIQCGLLMLLVLFEKRLNFSWRGPGMTIALGMGLLAAVDLAVSYAQGRFPSRTLQLDMVNGGVFVAVIAFWAAALRPLAAKAKAEEPNRLILQRWNEALSSYRNVNVPATANSMESFLPGIEKTVDRVLARKIAN